MSPELPGELPGDLPARYAPVGVLGKGAFGVVYKAVDRELQRPVAIKVVDFAPGAGDPARFTREALALAGVRHPGVVEVYSHGATEQAGYLVMELVEGETLDRHPDRATRARALLDVAAALEALHGTGIVHRDVKASNVLVTSSGQGRLIDFGLAAGAAWSQLTRTGVVMGTPAYLAPELLRGDAWSPASDWYGWGVCLFEIVEGTFPRTGHELMRWAAGEAELAPLEIRRLPADSRLRGLLEELLSPDPSRRPGAWDRVAGPVEDWLGGSPRPGPGPSPSPATPALASPPGRRRLPLALGLAAAATLGALMPRRTAAPAEAPESRTGAPATPASDEASRARARLEEVRRDLFEGHPRDMGKFTCQAASLVASGADLALADTRLTLKLGRLLAAFQEWWQVAPEATRRGVGHYGDPALEPAMVLVGGDLPHLLADLSRVRAWVLERGGPDGLERVRSLTFRRQEAEGLIAARLDFHGLLAEPTAPVLAVGVAGLARSSRRRDAGALHERLHRRLLERGGNAFEAASLAMALAPLTRTSLEQGSLSCEEALSREASARRRFLEARGQAAQRPDLAPAMLGAAEFLVQHCPDGAFELDPADLRAVLAGPPDRELADFLDQVQPRRQLLTAMAVAGGLHAEAYRRLAADLGWWIRQRQERATENSDVHARLARRPPLPPGPAIAALARLMDRGGPEGAPEAEVAEAAIVLATSLRAAVLLGTPAPRERVGAWALRLAALVAGGDRPGGRALPTAARPVVHALLRRLYSPLEPPGAEQATLVATLAVASRWRGGGHLLTAPEPTWGAGSPALRAAYQEARGQLALVVSQEPEDVKTP